MKKVLAALVLALTAILVASSVHIQAQDSNLAALFKSPPMEYRPVPLWFINGKLTQSDTIKQIEDAYKVGFGCVSPLPMSARSGGPGGGAGQGGGAVPSRGAGPGGGPGFGGAVRSSGLEPEYFSDAFLVEYTTLLENLKSRGQQLIFYDDLNFPSGIAGGKMVKQYPDDIRKLLFKTEISITGPTPLTMNIPGGRLMSVLDIDAARKTRTNLATFVKDNVLTYNVPEGQHRILIFTARTTPSAAGRGAGSYDAVDYMDPQAIDKFLSLSYDVFAKHFSKYFGNTIKSVFFDDVGLYPSERTWTYKFNEKFKQIYGIDPAPYYPAMWEEIGPETEAARVALYNTRAELLADGYPAKIAEWTAKHNLKASGHAPDNYNVQPVDFSGDVMKYYRTQQIPTIDLIGNYQRGMDGFKLISSTANIYDREMVAADVAFENNPQPSSASGAFSYIHKRKDGRDIYFFTNSTDDAITTTARVRGKITPELWDPHTGTTTRITEAGYETIQGQTYTKFPLKLEAVRSVFVVGAR